MKNSIAKRAIPETNVFVVKKINKSYFDPTFHFHPEYQLLLILKGEGTRIVGYNVKSFRKGDIVLTAPNIPHVWRSDSCYFDKKNNLQVEGIVIYFYDQFLGAIIQKEELKTICHLLHKAKRGLEIKGNASKTVSKMMLKLLDLNGVDGIIQLIKILNTIANSPECHCINHKDYKSENTEAETTRINKVYEYVMKNFRQKITLAEVAAIANMMPTSFSRYFKSRVNKSFSDFLQEIRIDHARKLLNEEKMSINQIGYECGFQTLSNFNKQFKKIAGKQPLCYRNECLKIKIDTYGNF